MTGGSRVVPYLKESLSGELTKSGGAFNPVAQLDNYTGLVFATFDPEGAAIARVSGGEDGYLDAFFDRREGGARSLAACTNGSCHAIGNPCREFGGDA